MNIVLGVTGGIAAYKAVLLARLLVEAGHDVHVIPTDDALRFVGKPTWEAISRHPVTTSVHEDVASVRHVALGQSADLVIVAPATANTIARMTAGLADDLLGTTLLATRAPVLIAPAMHTEMWEHPATQDNMAILRARGVQVVGPESGRLTGDDSGAGRMSEPDQIAARAHELLSGGGGAGAGLAGAAGGVSGGAAEADSAYGGVAAAGGLDPELDDGFAAGATTALGALDADIDADAEGDDVAASPGIAPGAALAAPWFAQEEGDPVPAQDLAGLRMLVTAGGTREPIDPVRYLGNRSSGRQGAAVAAAAALRGAKVVLLAANIDEAVLAPVRELAGVRVVPVGTAAELADAAQAAAPGAQAVVMAAAVADYRVANRSEQKIRKEDSPGEAPTISLVENPDILVGLVRERVADQIIVGFAAETVESEEELLERGLRKLARKGVDLLAVNAVGWDAGFESADNTLMVLDADGHVVTRSSGSKRRVADRLLDAVREELRDF
ncbi:bifunctional phosphopantothenoylcysteine decarboxylase/phosphopantothenate synthase [Leucobacter sp. HY1908]